MASRPDSDVLIVASALQGEGKSTFACHYALACASVGIKTLLIDGDLLNRSTTRAFGITGAGIGDILHGRIPLDRALKKEPKSGLNVIGAGPKCEDTSDVEDINVLDLDAFMRSCREQFDLVVIDSPAILPMAGNLPFMRTADRAVLVVEWDRTERRAVLEAVDMLGADAGKLAGVVLNKVAIGWYRLFGDSRYMKYFDYAAAQGEIRIRA
jgi:capsular exopolysaccharide synthesis family protein